MSEGIRLLTDVLRKKYRVIVVAPDRERSAVSMSLTLNTPLRIKQIAGEPDLHITNGTPVDCVNLGLKVVFRDLPMPDLVVSGINLGENVSEDIFYSGTVAGAFSGHLYNIRALAISYVLGKREKSVPEETMMAAVKISAKVIDQLIEVPFDNSVYNLNIPVPNNGKVLMTYPNPRKYVPDVVEKTDPRGRKYYWIGTGNPMYSDAFGSDSHAVHNGYVSLSKLRYDLRCEESRHGELFEIDTFKTDKES